jgi:hypothetical protein
MNKIITIQQTEAILQLLQTYNVGVKDYSAVVKLFNELPVEKPIEKVEKIEPAKE